MLNLQSDEMNQDEFMKMYTQLVIDNYKLNKYKTEKKTYIQKIEVVLDNHIQEVEAKKKIQDDIARASETKKTPEEIMLALNTNIEELVSLTRLSNSLAQNHIRVSQGLSNDAYTVG